MIRISKNADYAIIILAHFASADVGSVLNARETADQTHLPLPMVSKLLKALARAGLLASHRGAKGGYNLARPPREISIASIISAVEGPIGLTECTQDDGHCFQEPYCEVSSHWQKINRVVFGALRNMPLTEMIRSQDEPLVQIQAPAP